MKWIFVLLFALSACASYQINDPIQIDGTLDEDLDMSAISCSNEFCLLASDETNHIQIAKFYNKTLKILPYKINLGRYKKENDIEAMSFDGKYFYAIGSHGMSRKSGKYQASRFTFFRILIDKKGKLIELQQKSLSDILSQHKILKKYYRKKLQDNGINIEGLASDKSQVYIGFRAPVIDGQALILSFDVNEFFEESIYLNLKLEKLDLDGAGIRSLEIRDGIKYIISGTSSPSAPNNATLYIQDKTIKKYAVPYSDLKLEGMEILGSDLIYIYDSEALGMPTLSSID